MTTPETPLPVALPELVACPFCGCGKANDRDNGRDGEHAAYWLACAACGAETAPFDTFSAAIAAWNRRPLAAEALRGREARLEAFEDAVGDVLHRLEGWGKAYPLDVFPEVPDEQRDWLHMTRPGLIDRISASMGRHMAKCIAEDIAKLRAALDAAMAGEK